MSSGKYAEKLSERADLALPGNFELRRPLGRSFPKANEIDVARIDGESGYLTEDKDGISPMKGVGG